MGDLVKTIEELFEHELEDIYYVEQNLVKTLEKLENESIDQKLKEAFSKHRQETIKQVERIEDVFAKLGLTPKKTICHGLMGLIKEKSELAKMKPTKEIREIFNITAAIKTERYEISAYEGLIKMAKMIKRENVISLFEQNLKEETGALNTLEKF